MASAAIPAAGALAFAGAAVLVPVVRRVALARGVVDEPTRGRLHATATPGLGGLAVVVAVTAGSVMLPGWSAPAAGILAGALLVAAVGLWDDVGHVGPAPRLLVEAVAASVAFAAGARLDVAAGPLDLVPTVVVLVVLTNSFNLLDNMDGAAGVVATTTAVALVVGAVLAGQLQVGGLAAAVAGACLGFLLYNWHPATIFLGDTGSLFVGFLLSSVALELRFEAGSPAGLAAVGLLVGVPLLDTTLVVVSRVRAGRPIHVGGTDHLAHRLLLLGLPCRAVAAALALLAGATAALGLAVGRGLVPALPVAGGVAVVGGAALLALLRLPVYEGGGGRVVGNPRRAPRVAQTPA